MWPVGWGGIDFKTRNTIQSRILNFLNTKFFSKCFGNFANFCMSRLKTTKLLNRKYLGHFRYLSVVCWFVNVFVDQQVEFIHRKIRNTHLHIHYAIF